MRASLFGVLALTALAGAAQDERESTWDYLVRRYDANADGRIERKEYGRTDEHFARLDADGDGALTVADFEGGRRRHKRGRERVEPPKAGEKAPDFTLEVLAPDREPFAKEGGQDAKPKNKPARGKKKPKPVQLSSFRGKRPVALLFGSYT